MYATHRVIDSTGQPVGFMIGNEFHTDDTVRINIDSIDNLMVAEDGGIRPEKELPELPYTEAVNRRIYDDLVKRNPFVRDIQQELEEWKHDASHVVLQLEGSRQVGKTTELQKFAYVHYDSVIFVNLADDVYDFMGFIQSACTVADMESYCRRAHLPHYINDRHTVLIIDEIQNSSRAYNAIRRLYFSDCGIAAYLASKSMLDPTALAGILTETFVYNELHRLFKVRYAKRQVMEDEVCFSIYGKYELDFMVAGRDRVVYGIEVKTTDGAPVSLKVFIDRRLVDKGIVAKPSYGGHGESFDTIPIYTVGCRFPYR